MPWDGQNPWAAWQIRIFKDFRADCSGNMSVIDDAVQHFEVW